jgi:hypothetical protein
VPALYCLFYFLDLSCAVGLSAARGACLYPSRGQPNIKMIHIPEYSLVIRPPQNIIDYVAVLKKQLKDEIGWFGSANALAHLTVFNLTLTRPNSRSGKIKLNNFAKPPFCGKLCLIILMLLHRVLFLLQQATHHLNILMP